MSNLRSDYFLVYTKHFAEHGLSVAYFTWADKDNEEHQTYTVDLNGYISIEFDSHLPVRPRTLSVYDKGTELSAETLTEYVGMELAEAILLTKDYEFSVATISLSPENRFALAALQEASPSTPPQLRYICQAMLEEHALANQYNLLSI